MPASVIVTLRLYIFFFSPGLCQTRAAWYGSQLFVHPNVEEELCERLLPIGKVSL